MKEQYYKEENASLLLCNVDDNVKESFIKNDIGSMINCILKHRVYRYK